MWLEDAYRFVVDVEGGCCEPGEPGQDQESIGDEEAAALDA